MQSPSTTTRVHTCRWLGFTIAIMVMAGAGFSALGREEGTGGTCVPASERAGRTLGCYIVATQSFGLLGREPVFWHLDTYPTRAAAEAAKGTRGTVTETLGQVWLFTIADEAWRPVGGERVAKVGPLPINADIAYAAMYMEAEFAPGMKSVVHRHPGPEAWYNLTGETCLETPEGRLLSRGGETLIVPGGPPMELTATGTDTRRSLVLILHDTSMPAGMAAPDWKPKGLCQ